MHCTLQDPRDRKTAGSSAQAAAAKFEYIRDSFPSFQAVSEAIVKAGVGRARLVLGLDLTASNEWQGRAPFGRNSLHKLHPVRPALVGISSTVLYNSYLAK